MNVAAPTTEEPNTKLDEEVKLTITLSKELDETLDELKEVREQLAQAERLIPVQQRQIVGDPDEFSTSEEETWSAHSPLRKRPRYE